jgi:hypothetical protein
MSIAAPPADGPPFRGKANQYGRFAQDCPMASTGQENDLQWHALQIPRTMEETWLVSSGDSGMIEP